MYKKRLGLRRRDDENRELHCHCSNFRTIRWGRMTRLQRTMELERRSAEIN